jgi:uncharacterized repeat protein (TIGR02543 family)
MEGGRGGGEGKPNNCANDNSANAAPCRPFHGGDGGQVTAGVGLNGHRGDNGNYGGNDLPTSQGSGDGGSSRVLGPISSGYGGGGGGPLSWGGNGGNGHVRVIVTPLYTVIFDSNGGSVVNPSSILDVLNNTAIVAPTNPTRIGYIFNGWWTAQIDGSQWDFISNTVTSDTTLYAIWEEIPALTATFGDALSSVELPKGWSWEEGTGTVGNAGTQAHKAAFTRADNIIASGIDVTITVNKAAGSGTLAIEDWIYGEPASQPSASSETNPGFPILYHYAGTANNGESYSPMHIPPAEAGDYTATATFPESDNYKELALPEPFTIHRAEGECYVNMRSYKHGDSNPPNPEPISETNGTNQVAYTHTNLDGGIAGQPGKHRVEAIFEETDNYKKCIAAPKEYYICGDANCVSIPDSREFTYNGEERTGVDDSEEYTIEGDSKASNVGNYAATVTLVGSAGDFVWSDGTTEAKEIHWSIRQAPGTFPPLTPLSGTYSPSLTLADIELPQDYAWSTGVLNTPLNAGQNQSFPATYTCPSGNYTPANGNLTVNVAQAEGTFAPIAEPIEVLYAPGLTLANAPLPANYSWSIPATALGAIGSEPYPAIFTDPSGNYTPANGTINVNVAKGNGIGSVHISGWAYSNNPNTPVSFSHTNGTSGISYHYTGTANNGEAYSESEPPTEAGAYTITAIFLENDFYNSFQANFDFTIHRTNGTGAVSIEDWYFGEEPINPVAESETNGTEGAEYWYRGTDGTTYPSSKTPPANIGSYIVEAIFPQAPNYNSFTRQANFRIIGVTNLTVVWSEQRTFEYNKMVQHPSASAKDGDFDIPLMVVNTNSAAGVYTKEKQNTVMAEIIDHGTRRRYNLLENTIDYEITRKPLRPYITETALPAFEINAAKDTLKVPTEAFTDPETLTKILESIISYEGFATDTETNESDNAGNSLSGEPTIQLSYEAPAAAAAVRTRFIASPPQAASPPFLSRREPTTQKATAIISTESIASDNYILSNPTITILETIDTETAADLIFCHRGTYCTELSEEICKFINGTITASCDIARSSCAIDTDRCITNMLTHSCREIGGIPTESCQAGTVVLNTPSQASPLRIWRASNGAINLDLGYMPTAPVALRIYNLKGELVASERVNARFVNINANVSNGVYLFKVGNRSVVKAIR